MQLPLCCHRRNLFVCVSRITRPSGKNLVGLYEGVFDTVAIAVLSTCSFQGKLFSIFKLLCLVFVRYYLSSRTALEN